MTSPVNLEKVRHGVEKSIRYHQRRRGWLESCHRYLMFAIILCGSSAIVPFVPAELGLMVAAVLGALDLSTGMSVKARDYAILQGKFAALLAEMTRTPDPSQDQIADWCARRIEIEAEEPAIYWVVEADCDNEIRRSRDEKATTVQIPFPRRFFMHLFHQDGFVGKPKTVRAIENG